MNLVIRKYDPYMNSFYYFRHIISNRIFFEADKNKAFIFTSLFEAEKCLNKLIMESKSAKNLFIDTLN